MDRVFLDANVLFSIAYGSPDFTPLLDLARSGRIALLASHYVLGEAERNLKQVHHRAALESLRGTLEIVPPPPEGADCPEPLNPKDQPVLMAAISAGATHLLTGDRRDFGALYRKRILGVLVLPPVEYRPA